MPQRVTVNGENYTILTSAECTTDNERELVEAIEDMVANEDGSQDLSALVTDIAACVTTADLASTADNKGAELVGVRDAATQLTATNVEDALAEIMDYAQAIVTNLALTTDNNGAETVGVRDVAALYAAANVEDCLAEVIKYIPLTLADPGTGVAIPVTRSASVAITTAAAETNTLAIPTFVGQRLNLHCTVYAVGDRVVTAAAAINQTGNTIMTFGAAGDAIALEAITVAGALRWQVVANDGVALS